MTVPQPPQLDQRREDDFAAELRERAQAWAPDWALVDGEHDFGRALLAIAARFSSEVAERLDSTGEKMRRGFLDWLGVPRRAAQAARLPVVLKLTDAASEAVLATAPVQLQADADGASVVFETEEDVRVVPGRLETVVAVDADDDAFYLPPPGLSDLQPLEPLPTQWRLKSFAAAGATKLQLDPELGLGEGMILEAGGQQYQITKVELGIVTIEPELVAELQSSAVVRKATAFAPFDAGAINWQEHALYLGHLELLDIEAAATLEIIGARALPAEVTWQYWGKVDGNDESGWQPLVLDEARQQIADDAIVLSKPAGVIEPTEVNGIKSRWIRAYCKTILPTGSPFTSAQLSMRINAAGCRQTLPCPPAATTTTLTAEAMANTTPLVLDNVFYPLGKTPRQFDAFYLGSKEAFSKRGAQVKLCFELADRTFSALTAVQEGRYANRVLAGVARDQSLHLLSFDPATGAVGKFLDRAPLQPPRPGYFGNDEAGNAVALDAQPQWRLPVWSELDPPPFNTTSGFLVGASAGDAIWIWHEHSILSQHSGWIYFGTLPSVGAATTAALDGLVYLAGTPPVLVALRGGELFKREWPNGPRWSKVATVDGAGTPIRLVSLVPILLAVAPGRLETSTTEGMLGVDTHNKLFFVGINGLCKPLLSTFSFDTRIRPVAHKLGGALNVAAVTYSVPPKLVAVAILAEPGTESPEASATGAEPSSLPGQDGNSEATSMRQIVLDDTEVLAALEAAHTNGVFHVLATVRDASLKRLLDWTPFVDPDDYIFKSPALGGGLMEGAPLAVGGFVVIPSGRADILVSAFDPSLRLLKSADVAIGVVVADSIPPLEIDDLIVRYDSSEAVGLAVKKAGLTRDGEVFYELDKDFPPSLKGLDAYKLSASLTGTFTDPGLSLDPTDDKTVAGDWLRIDKEFYQVRSIAALRQGDRIATLATPNSNGVTPSDGQIRYTGLINTHGRVAPFMRLDTSAQGSGDWNADLLRRIGLIFPGQTPQVQRAKVFEVATDNRPQVVVLGSEFGQTPANPVSFLVDGTFGPWQRDAGETSTNPELSWEYWNGKGWWTLDAASQETQNLKKTGSVEFAVPHDIALSDWAGKTNFWIRARLVGGDYGREKVTARTKTLSDGSTEQVVERSLEGIHAPAVVALRISYAVCTEVSPTYVLAKDSGSFRDQSDANRTAGAIVEAFVPLAITLGRLAQAATSFQAAGARPPACDDPSRQQDKTPLLPGAAALPEAPLAGARALFIGLDATPSESPVNLLLLVEERRHSGFAPLTIQALVGGRFEPIVADDTTRALGESGMVSMAFAVSPTPSDLFGRQGLTWLRLAPQANKNGTWSPVVRGAYLNAVWASATETLTRELLGSSDGEPNLSVRLARPPVLDHTLELRVKEPLGDEDRVALRKADQASVLSDVVGLPGDWVLWRQVVDPNDESADARVYALNEATGEIRFGDGRHGRIPPIGRDVIMAFSYKRTEPGSSGSATVPGNLITARTALSLISPVATVESVTAAAQAAGGAPAEDDDRVLRFGFSRLRHRNRAVTLHDLEDLALQSSPDIVQARALTRNGSIRLVVVMKGEKPTPTAAQARELQRLLLASTPAALSTPDALRIEGPTLRRLRIQLKLRVERLNQAGALWRYVKERLSDLFDTATGGVEQNGWAMGRSPSEADIAFALLDAPYLDSIGEVKLYEIAPDESEQPWPDTLQPTELAMLAKDSIRIEFETAEVAI